MSPLAAPLLSWLLLAGTWTVDDDGPAHFPDIQSAIDALPPGDTILVMPGHYPSFKMTKTFLLLGSDSGQGVRVEETSRLLAPGGFLVAGLRFQQLIVKGVKGPAIVADCSAGEWKEGVSTPTVKVEGCLNVLFERCTFVGAQGVVGPADWDGADALLVDLGSDVTIVSSVLEGGPGRDVCCEPSASTAGAALVVRNQSRALLSSCPTVRGGRAGMGYCNIAPCDGVSGDGVVADNSVVVLRGRPVHTVEAGDPLFGVPGAAVRLQGGTLLWSGVTIPPGGIVGPGNVLHVQPDDPTLEPYAQPAPGGRFEMHLYGPAFSPWVLLVSSPGVPAHLPGPADAVWTGLPPWVVTTGIALGPYPTIVQLPIPPNPSLTGAVVAAQVFFPSLADALAPNAFRATNPVVEAVRF